jgi:hypothetical protein
MVGGKKINFFLSLSSQNGSGKISGWWGKKKKNYF